VSGTDAANRIYLTQLYELRVYVSGGSNWNFTRRGLIDAWFQQGNPWVKLDVPGGTPIYQKLGSRAGTGVLQVSDDKQLDVLFRNTDVLSDAGNQYLIGSTSYKATKDVFVYKGTNITVSTEASAEDEVHYTFTNFRAEEARHTLDENHQTIWMIPFNFDSVARTEP